MNLDKLRLASIGAWRGRERGLAVIAGVFLASLVITTVLSYGVGLSQVFFQDSLDDEIFDAKIEFNDEPSESATGWTNDTAIMVETCTELVQRSEIADCTVVLGKRATHGGFGFGDETIFKAMPLEMNSTNSTTNSKWNNVTWAYPEGFEQGPPISPKRTVQFFGPEAFDGVISDRLSANLVQDMGEWVSAEEMASQRGVYLPISYSSETGATVGEVIDELSFLYTIDSAFPGESEITEDNCDGKIGFNVQVGITHCQKEMRIENITILGFYEPWPINNPTLEANSVMMSWEILEANQTRTLMDSDHIYLGVALDRSQIPSESTVAAEEWLEILDRDIEEQNYTSAGIEVNYVDIISGTISFLNIFLGLIQAFDYIIMVPIVVLSLSVLIYGLVLSLEQRRKEISIHRVIGATAKGLRGMVMLELAVMSTVAWLAGYLLAMAAVPVVLSSVGFMEFSPLGFSVDPRLGFGSTLFTMIATLGLALIFGRSKAKDFIELEIDEGVRKVREVNKPKRWLHWTLFLVGMFAVIDSWLEMNGSEDGLNSNWFIEGLLGIFAPFMLWIGGALLLGRIGAAGPRIMQFFLGRTPLLNDVKRGLKGSGSAESVNRLAVIMLLTLSIVTLAAVQGYTGTVVDEKTASVQVGSELKVTMVDNLTQSEVEAAVMVHTDADVKLQAVNIPKFQLQDEDDNSFTTWVLLNDAESVLHWDQQAVPGDDVSLAMDAYADMTFSAGEDAAFALDLWGSGRGRAGGSEDILLDKSNEESVVLDLKWRDIGFNFSSMEFTETYHESSLRYIGIHEYVPGVSTIEMASTLVIGEQAYRSFVGDDEVDNLRANVWVVSIDGIDEDDLKALRAVLQSDELFDDAEDWKTAHENVERNGGLIFGTPGLLSLQFVVASLAAVASSFVFLSLVLNQRQKELAVLQAIGASPNQIIRLVLFEILSIIIVSMGLGMLLGMGLAISFNGLFEVFGFIFQIFGGSSTVIQRDLVWPWTQLGIVALSVLTAVVAALLLTTRKALGADLASVLKGE